MFTKEFNKRIDGDYLFKAMKNFISTPSPVGFYELTTPLLKKYAEELGFQTFQDERHSFYFSLEGEDTSKTVMVGAHMDTLGYMARSITEDGSLKLKGLGGVQNHSLEHEKAYLYTRDLRVYSGYIVPIHHSTHVFSDARTMDRDIDNMRFVLDEDVHSAEDVRALGIEVGDIIAPDPRFEALENGRIRSRYIDDKASVACLLSVLKYLKDNNIKPKYNTLFVFTYYEEMSGGGYVPDGVSEYVALDIGAIGYDNIGTERTVTIIAADTKSPYDRKITGELIKMAKDENLPFTVEVFPHYSTDSMTAFLCGNNIKHAAFGMTVYSSHGVERTFFESIYNSAELCLSYVLRR